MQFALVTLCAFRSCFRPEDSEGIFCSLRVELPPD